MEQLKDIGEFGFIARFAPRFDHLIKADDGGIGDDCALLAIDNERYHLVSTDLLIEDIHFLKDEISPFELGHKSLAVNLSDIAAMGGKALYSFLSIGIPKDTPMAYLDAFMEGYHALSEKYNVPLMGGDTTRSTDKLCVNVCVIGESLKKHVKQRAMAQTGDVIAVTGRLGDSAAGLKLILEKKELNNDNKGLIKKHYTPEPRLNEGQWLAQQIGTNAMMDISDGVSSDIVHLLKASHQGADIYLDQIPISKDLAKIAHEHHWDAMALALSGGEDYELLVTIDQDHFPQVQREFNATFGQQLFRIGSINESKQLTYDGVSSPQNGGFDHFK